MITYEEWAENILNITRDISNLEYQRNAWLGEGQAVSSPIEMYQTLFGDRMVVEFLSKRPSFLSEATVSAYTNLIRLMESIEYDDERPGKLLASPDWHKVSEQAALAARNLDADLKRGSGGHQVS